MLYWVDAAYELCFRTSFALFPADYEDLDEKEPATPEERAAVFLPESDERARIRSRKVFTTEVRDRVFCLSRRGPLAELVRVLAALNARALALSVADNPRFAQRGAAVAAVLEAIAAHEKLELLPSSNHHSLVQLGACVLSWTLRGRVAPEEIETCSPDEALDLLRADGVELTRDRDLKILARVLAEDAVAPLLDAPEEQVRRTALHVLAVMKPARYLSRLLDAERAVHEEEDEVVHDPVGAVIEAAACTAGDALLPVVEREVEERPDYVSHDALTEAAACLATRRSDHILRRWLPTLIRGRDGLSAGRAAVVAIRTGSSRASGTVLAALSSGDLDLRGIADSERGARERREFVLNVGLLLELAGRDDDPDELVERGIETYLRRRRPDRASPAKAKTDFAKTSPGTSGRAGNAPAQTIRREAPRVGRNDPCPCGSGKKYKKCCGRA
jgi:hypothetical protein